MDQRSRHDVQMKEQERRDRYRENMRAYTEGL